MVFLEDVLNFSDFVDLGITSEEGRQQLEEREIVTNLTLATPYKKGISKLTTTYDKSLSIGIGKVHEFSFNIPFYVGKNESFEKNKEIEFLKEYYLIKVELPNICYSKWFRIQRVERYGESDEDYLHVEAYTLEKELSDKIIENAEFKAENLFTIADVILDASQWKLASTPQDSLFFNGEKDYIKVNNLSSDKLKEFTLQFWAYEQEEVVKEEGYDFRVKERNPYRWAFGYTESRDLEKYTVVFQDYDGTVIDVQRVSEGNNAEPPIDPIRIGYEFIEWELEKEYEHEEGYSYFDENKGYKPGETIWYDGFLYEVVQEIAEEDDLNPYYNSNHYEYDEGYKFKQSLDELDEYDQTRIVEYIVGEREMPRNDMKMDIEMKKEEEENPYDGIEDNLKDVIKHWHWEAEWDDEDGRIHGDAAIVGLFLEGSINKDELIDYMMNDRQYDIMPSGLNIEEQEQILAVILGASNHSRVKRREAFRRRDKVSNALIFGRTMIGIGNNLIEIRKSTEDRERDDAYYTNSWTHWTFTYKYNEEDEKIIYKIYADGLHFYSGEIEDVEEDDLPDLDDRDFYIGAINYDVLTTNYFKGQLDEIRIFNKFFTQEEVENTMYTRYVADEENLRDFEKFTDEQKNAALGAWQCKRGDKRNDTVQELTEVFDHSGNESDLTEVEERQWRDDHVYLRNDQGLLSNFKFLFKHRTVELNDTNILNSFTESIADSFEAVPVFITGAEKDEAYGDREREIYFIKPEEVGKDQGLRFRYGVLLENVKVTDETTDFCTRLKVYGKDNLTLGEITTNGATYLDNFYYFHYPYEHDENYNVIKHSNFMTDNLAGAIQEYDKHMNFYDGVNERLHKNLKILRNEYSTLEAKIWDKEHELAQVEEQIDVVKEAKMDEDNIKNDLGINLEDEMDRLTSEREKIKKRMAQLKGTAEENNETVEVKLKNLIVLLGNKEVNIDEQENLIGLEGIEERINDVRDYQNKLYEVLDIENFFEKELYEEKGYFKYESQIWDALKERDQFIIEKTITEENIDDVEQLYEWGKEQFAKVSTPQIKVDIDVLDFIDLVEFDHLWDKIRLGDTVHIYREDLDVNIKAEIIEVDFDLEDGGMNFTIANVRDVKKPGDKFIDSIKNSISVSNQVEWSKGLWQEAFNKASEHDKVVGSNWDARSKSVDGGMKKKDQSVDISEKGVITKNPDDPDKFLVAQNGILSMTTDGGENFKHAIRYDGIVAERLISQAIVGDKLQLVNRTKEDNKHVLKMDQKGTRAYRYDGEKVGDANPSAENVSFKIDELGNAYFSGHIRTGGNLDEPNFLILSSGAIFGGRYSNGTNMRDFESFENIPYYLKEDNNEDIPQIFRFGINSEGEAFFHGALMIGYNEDAGESYEFAMCPDNQFFKAVWLSDVEDGSYLLDLEAVPNAEGWYRGNLRVGYNDIANKYGFEVDQEDGELRSVLTDTLTSSKDHHLIVNSEGFKMSPSPYGSSRYHFRIMTNGDLHVGHIEDNNYYFNIEVGVESENKGFIHMGKRPDETVELSSYESSTESSMNGTNSAIAGLVMRNHAGFTKRGTFWAGVTPQNSPGSSGSGAFIVPYNSDGVYNYFHDGDAPSARWKLDDGTYIRHRRDRFDIFFGGNGRIHFYDASLSDNDQIFEIDDSSGTRHSIIDEDARVHNAVYNDLAEYMDVKGSQVLLPGDVLVETGQGLSTTITENDKRVVGVYSDTYGFCLGKSNVDNKTTAIPIGMAGKVKVKVQGAVEVGDLITTSDIPGYGKAVKEYINGTVIGKALESKEKKENKRVWMLIMPC